MWLTWILSNWRTALIGLLSIALMLSTLHGRALKAERDAKTAEIDSMRNAAQTYDDQSKTTAKETSDAFALLVEQIQNKDIALANAKARFGSCNVARGIGPVSVLPTEHSAGKADVSGEPSEPRQPELVAVDAAFINACAADAAFVGAVQTWRVANDLPIGE